jgi:hypothetical protein
MKQKKLTNKIILIFIFCCISLIENVFSQDYQGDLGVINNTNIPIEVRIFAVSIPFEGIVHNINTGTYNRIDTLQNGSVCRKFDYNNQYTEFQMYYYYDSELLQNENLILGLVGGNPSSPDKALGHAKYEIDISVPSLNKIYKIYFNCLDSKYGAVVNGSTYGKDYMFFYNGPSNNVEFKGNSYHIAYILPYEENQPITEFKVWELQYNQTEPIEKRFYVRTTPFVVSPKVIYESFFGRNFMMREFIIGTRIVFDKVYNTYGPLDRWGYNTIEDPFYHYYYTLPPIPSTYYDAVNTYVTPAFYTQDLITQEELLGCKIIALQGDEIILKENKKLWISGYSQITDYGDTLELKAGSILTKETGAQLNACRGGTILDKGAICNWNTNSFSHILYRSELSYLGTSHTINNGGHIEIDGYARLKIGDNTTVTFDGEGTYLKLNPNATVKLGQNAKIIFQNGAYIDANGANFSSINSNNTWEGLIFENASNPTGSINITGCTFSGAVIPIKFTNIYCGTQVVHNVFNVSGINYNSGIYAENVYNILIQNNYFYMQSGSHTSGIYIRNFTNTTPPGVTINRNINSNEFHNGYVSLILAGYATEESNFYVSGNKFIDNNQIYNVIGRLINGTIKDNTESNNNPNISFHFIQSIPDLRNNYLTANNVNIYVGENSVVGLAPIITDDNKMLWTGGFNRFTANNSDNIQFYFGNAYLDYGYNKFIKSNGINSPPFHLFGNMNLYENYYNVRNNCFNFSHVPVTELYKGFTNQIIAPNSQGSTINCDPENLISEEYILTDRGFGITDTIYKTPYSETTQVPADEIIHSQASEYKLNQSYYYAILTYKSLIDNYVNSVWLIHSLYEIYTCYQGLDTSQSNTYKITLYQNLKTYLENKITSGNYDNDFIDVAYNIVLMCDANMMELNTAINGYEYIALNHPDPNIRLYASWDCTLLEQLLGNGGSVHENLKNETDDSFIKRKMNYYNQKINEDPVLRKVKKSFDSKKIKREKYLEYEIKRTDNDIKSINQKLTVQKEKDKYIENKSVSNLRTLKYLTKSERDKKQIEDIFLASEVNINTKSKNNINSNIPDKYDLFQNYPNPFNPVTTIKYAIPKSGIVTIIIYDITGREIQKLVNEQKQAGYYSVMFDGSNLSSGIYFYQIQTNDFVQVKKMVLIK